MPKGAPRTESQLVITAKCTRCPALIKVSSLVQPVCPICGSLMAADSAVMVKSR